MLASLVNTGILVGVGSIVYLAVLIMLLGYRHGR